jgi:hypothetical protein
MSNLQFSGNKQLASKLRILHQGFSTTHLLTGVLTLSDTLLDIQTVKQKQWNAHAQNYSSLKPNSAAQTNSFRSIFVTTITQVAHFLFKYVDKLLKQLIYNDEKTLLSISNNIWHLVLSLL